LKLVSSYLGLDVWDIINITVDGQKVHIIPAIRAHWDRDFYVLKKVNPKTHSREAGIEHALRVAAIYMKIYAKELAADYQGRINRLNEAKKGLHEDPARRGHQDSSAQKYPKDVRWALRALFTEDPFWSKKLPDLKALIAPTGFSPRLIDVGFGESAGRVNAAVEEVRDMAQEFVKALEGVAEPDKPITDDMLARGMIWFAVFFGGDGEQKHRNPFFVLKRIREGVPKNPPPTNPKGEPDWSKATGPRVGAVAELNGQKFRDLVQAAPPPMPQNSSPVVQVPPEKKPEKPPE
jgi:hypothetical protein